MHISGFTFIRNGCKFDFPFVESMRSLLPIVDSLLVNVGKAEDGTLEQVKALAREDSRIYVIQNVWDENLRREGKILGQQTNLALQACKGDWGIYLQADEVFHEQDYPRIRAAIEAAQLREDIDGLVFEYLHFYGDFSIINNNPSSYRREVRAIKLGRGIESYGDAQGFRRRTKDGQLVKLKVLRAQAQVFHYGWVRPPQTMESKTREMDTFWGGEGTGENHRYKRIIGLQRFKGTHPKWMRERIAEKSGHLDLLSQPLVWTTKDIRKVLALAWERLTGHLPFSYKNYKLVK